MTATIILAIVAAVVLIFVVLQWFSDRTYKPTAAEVIGILDACRNDKLSLAQFDEFSCVRIAYDSRLDAIREKFNQIVDDPDNIDGEPSSENSTALNDVGKSKISKLIDEVRLIDTK